MKLRNLQPLPTYVVEARVTGRHEQPIKTEYVTSARTRAPDWPASQTAVANAVSFSLARCLCMLVYMYVFH